MSTSRPVLLALAALGLGFAPLSAQAAPPERPSQVQADDEQQQEAQLARALDDEEAFRGQRARLLRLHALAWEDNDTKRVTELERLLKRLYSRHMRKMNEHRKHLNGAWRVRLEDRIVERREAKRDRHEERHDAKQEHREDRHDARVDHREERHDTRTDQRAELRRDQSDQRAEHRSNRSDRHDERHALRSDGRSERREVREAHRARRQDGQSPTTAESAPKRTPAAPRRMDPNGNPMRVDGGSDRRPVGRATHLMQSKDGQRVEASLGKKRPVPPARPAPGPGSSATMTGGMTRAAKSNSHRGTAGRASSRRLSSRRETETRAAASISRKNAEAEYRRLVKEIESDDD